MSTALLRGLRTSSLQPRIHSNSQYAPAKVYSFRFTSTSNSASKAASSSSSRVSPPRVPHSSLLNGPESTLPATLSLPIRQPNEPFLFKYAFKLGKAYALFYKTGVKNIWLNYQASRPIQTLIDTQHNFSLHSAVNAKPPTLTRSEFQLLVRNAHDTKRVPVFGLVFLICGEFTPLVVMLLSSVVPWTCRIPKQIESDRSKLQKRRGISFRNLSQPPPDLPTPTRSAESINTNTKGNVMLTLSRMQLLHISWSLGLSSSVWDFLGGQLPGLPTFLLRRKVLRAVEYIEMDDALIKASGAKLESMNLEEVRMALVDRGVDVLELNEHMLRGSLAAWTRSRDCGAPVEKLLLTR
jgi:hypothetical protein